MHPENRGSKYMQKEVIELKGVDKSTVLHGDFNTPLSVINKISRQQINKNIEEPNNTIKELDLIDICRKLHPITRECIFFL